MELSCIVFLLFYRTSNENSNKNEAAKVSRIDDDDDYDKDTDDELNELREAEKNKNMKPDIEIQKNLVKPSVAEDVVKNEVIDPYDVDTDDELNELREAQKRGKVSKPTLPAKTSVADMYGEETDEEDEKPDMEIKQNFVKTVENVVPPRQQPHCVACVGAQRVTIANQRRQFPPKLTQLRRRGSLRY